MARHALQEHQPGVQPPLNQVRMFTHPDMVVRHIGRWRFKPISGPPSFPSTSRRTTHHRPDNPTKWPEGLTYLTSCGCLYRVHDPYPDELIHEHEGDDRHG